MYKYSYINPNLALHNISIPSIIAKMERENWTSHQRLDFLKKLYKLAKKHESQNPIKSTKIKSLLKHLVTHPKWNTRMANECFLEAIDFLMEANVLSKDDVMKASIGKLITWAQQIKDPKYVLNTLYNYKRTAELNHNTNEARRFATLYDQLRKSPTFQRLLAQQQVKTETKPEATKPVTPNVT